MYAYRDIHIKCKTTYQTKKKDDLFGSSVCIPVFRVFIQLELLLIHFLFFFSRLHSFLRAHTTHIYIYFYNSYKTPLAENLFKLFGNVFHLLLGHFQSYRLEALKNENYKRRNVKKKKRHKKHFTCI